MVNTPPRKRGTPQIFVDTGLQVPHTAKMSQAIMSSGDSLYDSGMSRAQFREATTSPETIGNPTPLSTSRTTDHFQPSQQQLEQQRQGESVPADADSSRVKAPAFWDESLASFLERFCSPHQFAPESLTIWHDEMAKLKIPGVLSRDQWKDSDSYIRYFARQLAANNPLTGNLNWAIMHYLVYMRCLKTVDFLSEIDPALCSLQFILHISLKGLCLVLEGEKLRKVLANRSLASGTIDLIVDKTAALENGEVYAHAFRQTLADPTRLFRQLLHYTVLAISQLDLQRSQLTILFYQELLTMVADIFAPQMQQDSDTGSTLVNVLAQELLESVGPSITFNVASAQAEEAVHALLLNAVEPPSLSTQGLMSSAYQYLFSRHGDAQPKSIEQQSLLTLLLLISQPMAEETVANPYLRALSYLRDKPDDAPKIDSRVPFRKLFARLIEQVGSIEWTALFQVLVARNEYFRTYVLARTDTDTMILPLLKRVGTATALPVPASSSSAAVGSTPTPHAYTREPSRGGAVQKTSASTHTPATAAGSIAKNQEVSKQPNTQQRLCRPSWSPSLSPSQLVGGKTFASVGNNPSTSGTNGDSTAITDRASAGAQLRQGAHLPYALHIDNIPYVHLYFWMDIMLVLSEDIQFVEQMQRTTVDFWPAQPQAMYRQPLTHCIVAEMMRIFQLNLMLLKDSHLHRLALATLVNILNRSTMVTTAISQKLVKLFEMIQKRYAKLAALPHLSVDEAAELAVYVDTLAVMLSLFCRLSYSNNSQFIYCLLQAREVLSVFRSSESQGLLPLPPDCALDRAVQTAAELRVRIAYFHARISTLSNPQAKDILQLVENVVSTENSTDKPRADFCSQLPIDRQWSAFMLPLVWELLTSSPSSSAVRDSGALLLKQFEYLVL
ncbi:hypothetical protein H4R24_003548 [Coemansia sp. RSA 988]|nr:hypothetical protein H4R24_003548 [Coemansia sp. RSA 988]